MGEKSRQKIVVFQQNGSGAKKIKGIEKHAKGLFHLEVISVEDSLPSILDDTAGYLPSEMNADLVLDFLMHPDLSFDLSLLCQRKNIPVVASGKKHRLDWPYTPPT